MSPSGRRMRPIAAGLLTLWALATLAGCVPEDKQGKGLIVLGPAVREGPRDVRLTQAPDWGGLGANPAHTGVALSLGPEQATRLWSVPVPAAGPAQPAVAADGTVYLVGEQDGSWHLTAVSPAGQVAWTQNLGAAGPCTPAIGPDGTVYAPIGAPEPGLVAVTPQGAARWHLRLHEATGLPAGQPVPAGPGLPYPSPVIHKDGLVLVAAGPALAAVTPEGQVAWTWSAGDWGTARVGTPGVGPDGSIYLPVAWRPGEFALVQLSRKGKENWRYPLPGRGSTPAVGSDGAAHVVAERPDGTLHLLVVRIGGQLRWERTLSGLAGAGGTGWPRGDAGPGLSGGFVQLGALAVDRKEERNTLPAGYQAGSPAALDAGGTRYLLARQGSGWFVVAVEPDGRMRWQHPLAAPGSYPVVGAGRVYVVERTGQNSWLVALGR